MAIESFFLFDVKETFLELAAQDDDSAERTFLYSEITIRAKTVMDHVSNSFGSDKKAWTEKLQHFLSLSLQAVNGTPLLSDYHRHHSLDCPVIFALCDPKTAGWRSKFHIPFLKSGMPSFLEAFKVLQLPGQRDNVPDSLHIFSKDEHAGSKSPQSKDKATAPVDASAILNNLFGDQFKTVSSPAHVRQDPFEEPPKKRRHSSDHETDTLPDFGTAVAAVTSPSEYMLPCEQPESRLVDIFNSSCKKYPMFLLPSAKKFQPHPYIFARDNYVNGIMTIHHARLAFLGAHHCGLAFDIGPSPDIVYPPNHRLVPGYISSKFASQVYGIKSSEKEKSTAITLAKPANVTAMLHSAYRSAINAHKYTLYSCPAIDCFDLFERNEYIQAIQSAAFEPGLKFQAHLLPVALTPWHFVSTIQSTGIRLPENGFTSLNMFKFWKNLMWFFQEMFHMPDRYERLDKIHPGCSPWSLASPLAGNSLYLFKRFDVHEFGTVWDALGSKRLAATAAVILHICQLIEIMSDWPETDNPAAHCIEAHVHDSPERSDVLILRPTIRVQGHIQLQTRLEKWRTTADDVFSADILRAVALPTKGPFNKPVPPDVLPISSRRNHTNDAASSSLRRDGRFTSVHFQPSTNAAPPTTRHHAPDTNTRFASTATADRSFERSASRPDHNSAERPPRGNSSRSTSQTGTYNGRVRNAARALLAWENGVNGGDYNVNHLISDWSRAGIIIPKVDGVHICIPYILRDHAGCSNQSCRRAHIDIPNSRYTADTLRQLSTFIDDNRVAGKFRKTQAFLDLMA
ncbi:hypothetical protein MPSEU_000204100 [Mayamaea pseudoterrestris]|nr:hypothetical protein MPSEU_000204100 [Mayamaea pseudoterrestris]